MCFILFELSNLGYRERDWDRDRKRYCERNYWRDSNSDRDTREKQRVILG